MLVWLRAIISMQIGDLSVIELNGFYVVCSRFQIFAFKAHIEIGLQFPMMIPDQPMVSLGIQKVAQKSKLVNLCFRNFLKTSFQNSIALAVISNCRLEYLQVFTSIVLIFRSLYFGGHTVSGE